MMKRIILLGTLFAGSVACSLANSQESQAIPSRLVEKFDKNGDGFLNTSERSALKRMREGRRKWKATFDQNGDGKFNKKEKKALRQARKQRLKRFDKDGNGKLNRKERQAFRRAVKRKKP